MPEGIPRPTLGALLYERIADLLIEGDLGVQRSDFMRQVAARFVRNWWPDSAGAAPSPRAALSTAQLDIAVELLASERFGVALADAASLCRLVAAGLELQLGVRMPQERPRAFSERIAVWVGGQVATDNRPDVADIAAFVTACIDERLAKGMPIPVEEFIDGYRELYDIVWDTRGTSALTSFPPSSIDLGEDVRPPLVRASEDGERDDWTRGTDRAVYERYRFAFKRMRRPRPGSCHRPECLSANPPVVTDRASAEVQRAGEPYGLQHPEHRQLLRSVHLGVGAEPQPGHRSWSQRLSPCSQVELQGSLDEVVMDAMAVALQSWHRASGDRLLGNLAGDLSSYQHVIAWVLVRRGWTSLLGRETSVDTPARRCWLRSLVNDALYKEAPAKVREWVRDGSRGPRLGRTEASMQLLGTAPTVAVALRDELPGWRDRYLALVDARGSRRGYLAPAEARSMVQKLFRGGES